MQDREIVQRLVDGDRAAMAAVYDRYAMRLYDYCVGMLRDRDSAGDAVHDTLLVAADRAHQLRDPDKLRPWLYAIARNECLRSLRARRRETELDAAGDIGDSSVDVERGLRAAEAHALVRDAAAGLNPGDREVLDLTLRHELAGDELAAALGVPTNHANALVSRARAQLERAVGALVMARTGQQDCPELASMLAGWDGALTALVRKRVSRHVEKCAVCAPAKQSKVSAAALFAAVPMAVIPIDLRSRVTGDFELVAHAQALGKRAEPFDGAGFPVPLDRRRPRHLAPLLAGSLALVLLLGTAAMFWGDIGRPGNVVGVFTPATTSALPTTPPSPTALPSTTPSESPSPSETPSATPSPRPSRSLSPTPSPSESPSPSPTPSPPVLTFTASGPVSCGLWSSNVRAVVTSGEVVKVTGFWNSPNGSGQQELTFLRGAWRGRFDNLPVEVEVTLYAVGVTTEGVEGQSNAVTLKNGTCID